MARNMVFRLAPRIPIGLLLACLIAAGIGSAIAVDGRGDVSMVVPEAMIGDAGIYNLTYPGDGPSPRQPAPPLAEGAALRFSWARGPGMGPDGATGPADHLAIEERRWDWDSLTDQWRAVWQPRSISYKAGSEVPYLDQTTGVDAQDPQTYEVAGIPLLDQNAGAGATGTVADYAGATTDCVLGPALGGLELAPGTRIAWDQPCTSFRGGSNSHNLPRVDRPAGSALKVVGTDALGSTVAMRVETEDGRLVMWFQPGLPVPVRLQVSDAFEPQHVAVLDLVSFTEGTTPRTAAPWSAPNASVTLAPTQPWGPDEAGIDHTFPLSRAYQEAVGDEQVAAFIGAAGYLRQALFIDAEIYGMVQHTWALRFSDGDEALDVTVGRMVPAAAAGLPSWAQDRFADVSVEVEADQEMLPMPTRENLPKAMPNVASALARHADRGGVTNGWGFTITGSPEVAVAHVYGSMVRIDHVRATPAEGRPTLQSAYEITAIDDEGKWNVALSGSRSFGGYGVTRSSADNPDPPGPMSRGERDPWTTAAIAGTLGAGIMAGVLYLLWPVIKTGGAGLFTRVGRHQLLDHPTRRAIHDLVGTEPGIHHNEVARRLALANGTLRHHLQILVGQDLLRVRHQGSYTCYFLASAPRSAVSRAPSVRSEGASRVLAAIEARPGITGKEVADELALSPGTVGYHVKRLEAAGAVKSRRRGREVALSGGLQRASA